MATDRFQQLVAEATKNITEISPEDAAAKLQNKEAVIVDVRDKDEHDEEHIPHAINLSRGTIELDIEEKVPDLNTMVICHCGGGAAPLSPPKACKKWATKMSAPWPAASRPGSTPGCRPRSS